MKLTQLTLAALLVSAPFALHAQQTKEKDYQVELPAAPKGKASFVPPSLDSIPDNQYGEMVRYGRSLFLDTQQLKGFVGDNNALSCANCHLNEGRMADSAPLWGAYTLYPAYRKKNDHVNTFEERIQGCFTYSMNGTPPPSGSKELTALVTYSHWLATGAPVGIAQPGRGYPKLKKPAEAPSIERGAKVYAAHCSTCHGDDGQGQQAGGKTVFPPLWGEHSFNWGAGMHRINTAAGFIKANMPLGKPNSLSDQQAWDVAAYINSHERPQDPRFKGDLKDTSKTFHKHQCLYEKVESGQL